MDGKMFDGLISGLLIIGILIGLVIASGLYGLYWFFQHLAIRWVS